MSATGNFHRVTHFFKFLLQQLPSVTLYLDDVPLQSTADTAPFLQLAGQGLQGVTGQWQTLDEGDGLTSATLRFPMQAHDTVTDSRGFVSAADTALHRAVTLGAESAAIG